jgi:hypothetical protein
VQKARHGTNSQLSAAFYWAERVEMKVKQGVRKMYITAVAQVSGSPKGPDAEGLVPSLWSCWEVVGPL